LVLNPVPEARVRIEEAQDAPELARKVARVTARRHGLAGRGARADQKSELSTKRTTLLQSGRRAMAEQKTPHTQTEQNTTPEQTDLENNQDGFAADGNYEPMESAETGASKARRKIDTRAPRHRTEPEQMAHEGSVHTRTPKKPAQGITSHSAEEESARQEEVVNARPDAQAGVNHSK
jgi:hypothetical protein